MLETERLLLREFQVDDAAFLTALMNSPGWLQFIGDRGVHSLDDAKNYIVERLQSSYKKFGFGLYVVISKEDTVPVGMCGLVKRETLDDVDIGFALLPEHYGKGYAVEAASSVLTYAVTKLKLKRVVAIATVDNRASIKLLEKIGLKFDRLIRFGEGESLKLFVMQVD